jgi:predicted transcriptional regulator
MRKGNIPDKPYEGERTISAKVSPEFQERLRDLAVKKDTSVSMIIKTALFNYMAGAQIGR